jgi:hypothetical protein
MSIDEYLLFFWRTIRAAAVLATKSKPCQCQCKHVQTSGEGLGGLFKDQRDLGCCTNQFGHWIVGIARLATTAQFTNLAASGPKQSITIAIAIDITATIHTVIHINANNNVQQ